MYSYTYVRSKETLNSLETFDQLFSSFKFIHSSIHPLGTEVIYSKFSYGAFQHSVEYKSLFNFAPSDIYVLFSLTKLVVGKFLPGGYDLASVDFLNATW